MISENTPLASSSSPLTYTPPYRRWSIARNDNFPHTSDARAVRMREYYNSVFSAGGIDIGLRDVAVVRCTVFRRCFPRLCPACIFCQGVSAKFCKARLHLVADLDGAAGAALLDAVAGRTACTSGTVWIDGVATGEQCRRYRIASIGTGMLLFPHLSVEDHLWGMVHLHKKERHSWKREMVLAASNFTNLDTHQKVCDLTEMERFRLQVAVELVLDPPALFFYYSFDSMTLGQQVECYDLLYRLAQLISKTVVLCTRSLSMHLFSAAESLLLLGSGGVVLYSGRCKDAIPYFNSLRIPSSIPEPAWRTVPTPPPDVSVNDDDGDASSLIVPPLTMGSLSSSVQRDHTGSESRLYSTMCTPPRLSSRLLSARVHDGFSHLLPMIEPDDSPRHLTAGAVVEVATSGDLVDLAAEWADGKVETLYYAAKYYDSPVHAALLAALERDVTHPLLSSNTLTEAVPQAQPNSLWKLSVLLAYSLRQITADVELVEGVLFFSVGMIIVSALAHSQPESQGGMFNIRGLIFMAFTLVLFTNLVTMEYAGDRLRTAVLHCKRQLYGVTGFIVCLSLRVMLIHCVYLVLLIPFVIFVLQSSYALVLLVWCVGCSNAAFHYVAAALFSSRRWTMRVWYTAFGYNIFFSGFLLNLHTVPPLFSGLSFLRWGYGAVLHTWLHGNKFQCDGANNTSYCYTGDDYLKAQGFAHDSVEGACRVLALYSVGLMTLLGCVLYLKSL
jgi:ABC-type multidrug transport system ATPase subunit